ncbi:hypothetical protein V6N11_043858 [Hibiscus sabdariffa]|uniref:Uncharacterized protein n=1 Tax=Hibiscus sabdariffa TaxID=183260 RepID=A0ABR2RDL9_9ROSI
MLCVLSLENEKDGWVFTFSHVKNININEGGNGLGPLWSSRCSQDERLGDGSWVPRLWRMGGVGADFQCVGVVRLREEDGLDGYQVGMGVRCGEWSGGWRVTSGGPSVLLELWCAVGRQGTMGQLLGLEIDWLRKSKDPINLDEYAAELQNMKDDLSRIPENQEVHSSKLHTLYEEDET